MEPFGSELNPDMTRRNIYSVLPCPKCKSVYRYPTQPTHSKHPDSILCDECGLAEPLDADTRAILAIGGTGRITEHT